jgi:hypothetical protein
LIGSENVSCLDKSNINTKGKKDGNIIYFLTLHGI